MDRLDESAVNRSCWRGVTWVVTDIRKAGLLWSTSTSRNGAAISTSTRKADGAEVRPHRNIPLGLKSEMDKGEAKAKLREIIARETKDVTPAPVNVTLRWFYENRFLPQKEQQWKITSRPKTKRFVENYLLKRFGERARRTWPRSRASRTSCGAILGSVVEEEAERFTITSELNPFEPNSEARQLVNN